LGDGELKKQPQKGIIIVITGPSGVGKSSIVSEARRRSDAKFSVSATTRKPRPGEKDTEDYYFIDEKTFKNMVDAGEMLESAEVFGEFYGTPAGPVLQAVDRGERIMLEIDVQGALQVARKLPDAKFILITPPSMDELKSRLTGRGSETQQQIDRRLGQAESELRMARESGIFQHEIINDDLETAIQRVVVAINQE
jgi:guanylate kinase